MIPIEKFLEFGSAGLLAALLAWAIWNMSRMKKTNNPGNSNASFLRENTAAIQEMNGNLKELCRFLKSEAENDREHRRECREHFQRRGP